MHKNAYDSTFQAINRGYNTTFRPGRLSLGVVVPLETYITRPVPTMTRHIERVQLAEELGFSAIWLRDVPFNVPSFGDAGQMFDPFVYLGLLAAQTEQIALGVDAQDKIITRLRERVKAAGGPFKPAVQSLYIDLVDDPDSPPQQIHLGFRSG